MKMHILKIVVAIGFISVLIGSCECVGSHICTDNFYFRIVNKNNGKDMVLGSTPLYNPDSVYLFINLYNKQVRKSAIDSPRFVSTFGLPRDTLYLHLNATDIDTLLINYHFKKTYCCKAGKGYGKVSEIKFNGMIAQKKGDTFIFQK